jgi:hypothetical protein
VPGASHSAVKAAVFAHQSKSAVGSHTPLLQVVICQFTFKGMDNICGIVNHK